MRDESYPAMEEIIGIGRRVPLTTDFGRYLDGLAVRLEEALSKTAALERGEHEYTGSIRRKMRPSGWSAWEKQHRGENRHKFLQARRTESPAETRRAGCGWVVRTPPARPRLHLAPAAFA
jgi:hypothetical protein